MADQHLLRSSSRFECNRNPKLGRVRHQEFGNVLLWQSHNWPYRPHPGGAVSSAIKFLSMARIMTRGRCGGQLQGESKFPFRSLHVGPCQHGSDSKAHQRSGRRRAHPRWAVSPQDR